MKHYHGCEFIRKRYEMKYIVSWFINSDYLLYCINLQWEISVVLKMTIGPNGCKFGPIRIGLIPDHIFNKTKSVSRMNIRGP